MATNMRIDFVGDVSCPWCYVGFYGLLKTIMGTQSEYNAQLYIQPFEMHPDLGPQGVNAREYAMNSQKLPLEHVENAQKMVVQQAAVYGLPMQLGANTRLWNTHDAHRLLYWTGTEGKSLPLMRALFHANFVEQSVISDHAVLLDIVARTTGRSARAPNFEHQRVLRRCSCERPQRPRKQYPTPAHSRVESDRHHRRRSRTGILRDRDA
jgi:predicted DsbA family dithiol-disulfide isomerase